MKHCGFRLARISEIIFGLNLKVVLVNSGDFFHLLKQDVIFYVNTLLRGSTCCKLSYL